MRRRACRAARSCTCPASDAIPREPPRACGRRLPDAVRAEQVDQPNDAHVGLTGVESSGARCLGGGASRHPKARSSSSACTSSPCTAEGGQRDEKGGWLGCQTGGMGEECEHGGLMGGPGSRWHALCPAARAKFDVRASGGSGIVRGLRSRTVERRPAPCAWAALYRSGCSTATRQESPG